MLKNVETLMRQKLQNKDFDSYGVYVKIGDKEHTFMSDNINEDTYFDIASCGKILVTTPLILQAIDKGLLSLESTLKDFFDNVFLKYFGLYSLSIHKIHRLYSIFFNCAMFFIKFYF